MGLSDDEKAARAAALVDELSVQQRVVAAAEARQAALMVEFGQLRYELDVQRLADRTAVGLVERYAPAEFAAAEIGLAITATRHAVGRTVGVTQRLRAEAPDAWDAWVAGHIDRRRVDRISRALRRLTRDSSKRLLNQLVVAVATCKTPELLGRWLNAFVARVEPDQTNERMRRSFEDRYVSIRPDIDGISFLSAALSAVDADAVDQVLNALAGLAEPGDSRTWAQRRADVLMDLVLGRVSNGCHVTWDDDDDLADDEDLADDDSDDDGDLDDDRDDDNDDRDEAGAAAGGAGAEVVAQQPDPRHGEPAEPAEPDEMVVDEWEQPASVFRPDPRHHPDPGDTTSEAPATGSTGPTPTDPRARPRAPERPGRPVITPCPHEHPARPLPVTIGVVVSIQSLLGWTDTPGQLADRSALVPADLIRDLAAQPGTLFYRLLTDPQGNLLDTTELGRFPSRTLGLALTFRDGACTHPICTVPTRRCDIDHLHPAPQGPTTAVNLNHKCRPDHRAKTHAGHHTTRTGHTTSWTTPTGHTYTSTDPPLPVENWPDPTPPADPEPNSGLPPDPGPAERSDE